MLTLALATWLSAAPAQLSIEVKPEDSVVKVDGKKIGTATRTLTVKLSAGKHTIRVEHKGDATTEDIVLKAGEKKTWKWEFTGLEKKPETTEPVVPEGGEGSAPAPSPSTTP
jgi:hypothetical protein